MTTVADRVRKVIAEQTDVEVAIATDEKLMVSDLAIDSLGIVELILVLEEQFEIDIPDQDVLDKPGRQYGEWTVREIIEYMEVRMGVRPETPRPPPTDPEIRYTSTIQISIDGETEHFSYAGDVYREDRSAIEEALSSGLQSLEHSIDVWAQCKGPEYDRRIKLANAIIAIVDLGSQGITKK